MTRFESIGPDRAEEALAYCQESPMSSVYLAGWIADGGLHNSPVVPRGWILAERDKGHRIVGLCFLSATGILMPVMSSAFSLEHLVGLARQNPALVRVIVGDRALVAALWERLGAFGLLARLARDQMIYAVEEHEFVNVPEPLPLTVAREQHLDEVVEASAAMAREEANDDPQSRNPGLFRDRIRTRLARGRDFVHFRGERLIFKSNVSAVSPIGGQIEGIYTIKSERRHGFGRRGTAAVTAWVLERSPRATLLVNDDNAPARVLYESLGYKPCGRSRTIFVAP
ncbi:MAG: GNAT family N-acetyltransferase [Myxococcota bacterium]